MLAIYKEYIQPVKVDSIMKKMFLGLLVGLIHLSAFSQDSKTIRISKDIELVRITDNAYEHISYADVPGYGRVSGNGLIFINGNEAFLFDTPWNDSQTKALCSYIADSMKLTIVGFIPNHWHDDCMGGLGYLKAQNIKSYANQLTIDIAKSKGLPTPEYGFKDSLQLQLGDKFIQCYFFGAAHSLDNIVVWIPSEQILFAGCMIKSTEWSSLGNTSDGDLMAYPKTIDRLIQKFPSAKIVIPGHGSIGGIEFLIHTKSCWKM